MTHLDFASDLRWDSFRKTSEAGLGGQMRRWRLFASAGIAGALVAGLGGAAGAGGATHTDWPQYLYSPGHASAHTAAEGITPANAAGRPPASEILPGPSARRPAD